MEPWIVGAILLDMDGTLLDTERIYLEALITTLRTFGYSDGVEALSHRMIGIPGPECGRMLLDHFGADFPLRQVNSAFDAHCTELMRLGPPLKPGAIALLDAIEAVKLPKAIVTSSSRRTAAVHLGLAGIGHRFDAIVTRDDVRRGKPHPDVYIRAAARLDVWLEACLAIEDSNPGVAAAHAAGMITLMVPDILPPTEETRARCAAVLPDLDAAIELLTTKGVLAGARRGGNQSISS
jgi:HAD superfamily hydrolase (TIGR01509 family)